MNQTRRTIGGLALPALLLTLLLCVAQSQSRPSTENDADVAALPPNVDNVELHHVKLVNGIMTEDHPIVMYKEDFVNGDNVHEKNQTNRTHQRKYEHVQRTRHHHSRPKVEKSQEKILFDVLPETPIFSGDTVDDSDAYNFEASSLMEPTKAEAQQKFPKKYHSRQRRQAYYFPVSHSSNNNPYFTTSHQISTRKVFPPGNRYLPATEGTQHYRYHVSGKKPYYRGRLDIWTTKSPVTRPVSIGNRDNFEDESDNLFHNSNPEDADFSVFDRPRPTASSGQSSGSASVGGFPNFQSPPLNWAQTPPQEVPESRPIWGQSIGRPNVRPGNLASALLFSRPRPSTRQDALIYPEEVSYKQNSACHRASHLCCNLDKLASLYECFLHQGCEESLSNIFASCS